MRDPEREERERREREDMLRRQREERGGMGGNTGDKRGGGQQVDRGNPERGKDEEGRAGKP